MNIQEEVIQCSKDYYEIINGVKLTAEIDQNLNEIIEVITYLNGRKFDNFLEIGSCVGGSLWLYSNLLCNQTAKITSIDIDGREEIKVILNKLNETGRTTKLINKNTARIREGELDTSYDLVHIDGDHTKIAVLRDFNMVYPLVRSGGVIIFHDCLNYLGVTKLIRKLETKGETIRVFIGDKFTAEKLGIVDPLGIAVLTKK